MEALSNLGAIHRALGIIEAAIAATRQAIILVPDFAQAHSNLRNALENQGPFDQALDAYRQAASLNPGFVAPMDQQPFYSEKIVHLPDCYQPNDTKRLISNITPTRAECGLPEQSFVFCSFNNTYKITPKFFDIWLRLLMAIPGSVLWLLDANDLVKDNLRGEAVKRGIDAQRLVFAPRQPSPEHLAATG